MRQALNRVLFPTQNAIPIAWSVDGGEKYLPPRWVEW